jgi:hypothetical protein
MLINFHLCQNKIYFSNLRAVNCEALLNRYMYIAIDTVKPVLCDNRREQSNMVT